MNIDTTPKRITHEPAANRVAIQKQAAHPVKVNAAVQNHAQPQEAVSRVALTKTVGNRVDIAA